MTKEKLENGNEEPTNAWFIVSIILGVIGGIIGYFAGRNCKQEMANRLLKVGIYATVAVPLWYGEIAARCGIFETPVPVWGSGFSLNSSLQV